MASDWWIRAPDSNVRASNFDGIRLSGAVMVLVSHQFALCRHAEPGLFGVTLGNAGVAMFFGISGYLVSRSWHRDPDLVRFIIKRLLRLWPALSVCVLVCSACAAWLPHSDAMAGLMYPIAAERYLSNLFFLSWDWAFFPGQPFDTLNGSLWTIPLELAAYCGIVIAGITRSFEVVVVCIIAATIMMHDWHALHLYSCFAVGSTMYLWPRRWNAFLLVILALAAVVELKLTIQMMVAALAVAIGVRSWWGLRAAGRRGDFSYGIYLWAWPLQQTIVMLYGTWTPLPALLTIALAATSVASWLSWNFVESLALRWKPSLDDAKAIQARG